MAERSVMVAADFILTGGMDRANYALADYLARQGGEVHLVAHEVAHGLLGYANVHWQRVARPLGHDALGWGALRRAGMRAAKAAGAGARVFVNGGNCPWPDVNWVHYLHAAYFAPVEGPLPRRVWQRLKHRRALADEQEALRRARVVIANSEATRDEIISRLGVPPERVHTVYYGTDAQELRPITAGDRAAARAALGWEAERRVVLFVGALGDRRKGFDTVLAAWQQVCADPGWEADLVVVGRGSELEAWRRRTIDWRGTPLGYAGRPAYAQPAGDPREPRPAGAAPLRLPGSGRRSEFRGLLASNLPTVQTARPPRASDAALAPQVRFLGRRDDVPRLLAASDLMVAPTRYEAYGLAVHEAWARELPALVSAAAGVAELCPPQLRAQLLLDDPEDATALAARLRAWHQNPGAFAEWMPELGPHLRAHSWDDMAAAIVRLADERETGS